jgi:uncharacterized protein YecT (DUF1311 family)
VNHQLTAVEDEMKHTFDRALGKYTSTPEDQKAIPVLPKSEQKEQLEWEERMRHRLIISQKAWLAYRENSCEAVQEMYEGGTFASVAVPLCKIDITKARIEFLRSYFGDEN